MRKFEKWLEFRKTDMGLHGVARLESGYILDKYRTMTCKMEHIPNYIAFGDDEAMNTMSAYKCSVCGSTTYDGSCSYCSSCGRKVIA